MMNIISVIFLSIFTYTLSYEKFTSIEDFIRSLEEDVKSLGRKAEEFYSQRCNQACKLSYSACSNVLPEMSCSENFPVNMCNDTIIEGRMLNVNTSAVILQNKNYPYASMTDQSVKEVVCSFSNLDPHFKRIDEKYNETKWLFIGSFNGVHRTYPARDRCDIYDNRDRPWYVAAATGSKNILIVIDTSGSMSDQGKLILAKKAAKRLLETLTINDWAGIINFSDQASAVTNSLLRMTAENKKLFDKYIDNLSSSASTNYEAGMRKVYELLDNTKGNELSCENIVLFLTDGEPTVGITDENELANLVTSLDRNYNATWLTYAFGKDANPKKLLPISCARYGITYNVPSVEDIQSAMLSYYLFLSTGITRDSGIWVEPYEDVAANGLGTMTSYSIPIYDRSKTPPALIAVFGADVLVESFQNYKKSEDLLSLLISAGSKCSEFRLSECQLNQLRGENTCINTASPASCSSIVNQSGVCVEPISSIFKEGTVVSDTVDIQVCCSTTKKGKANVGAIVGGILGGIAVIVIITYIICKLCQSNKVENKKVYNAPGTNEVRNIVYNQPENININANNI